MNLKMQKAERWKVILLSGALTFAIMILLFWIKGFAPFGTRSVVVMDGTIQYLDFFAYLKDVFNGENSIGYSFTKTLGGCNVAVFSYYLSSPFNILLLFFDKSQIHIFFDLTVALKLSLAAMTFSFFITGRFGKREEGSIVYILTAVGYGLCQYNLAQASNIMWLDGVYMLPLILLQVSHIAQCKKSYSLPFLVGAALLFNWYSAGIDLVFSGIWFLFEFALYGTEERISIKSFPEAAWQYIWKMLVGLLLSAGLFLPTIGALQRSGRGSLELGKLLDFSFLGELPSVIQKYSYGSVSELGSPALFCGSLAMVLALFTVFCRKIDICRRRVYGGLFAVSVLIFYWQPFFLVFSLFKDASSYWCRYSYVGIFALLFLTNVGAEEVMKTKELRLLLPIAAAFSGMQVFLYYCRQINEFDSIYKGAVILLMLTVAFCGLHRSMFKKTWIKRAAWVFLLLLGCFDLTLNADSLLEKYSSDEVAKYQDYQEAQESTISKIQAEDASLYRISQTTTRNMGGDGLTAYYNEGLAYNYASLSGYTSSPDDAQREFLNRLGYRINGVNMCITNTSILGADSLLGVKYILSPYEIKGLEEIAEEDANGKETYLNPYAFPLAFSYDAKESIEEDTTNPFLYQNTLYKELFGVEEALYSPISFHINEGDTENETKIQLELGETSNVAVYGSIPWNYEADSWIYVNGEFVTKYACWLSPSVFYIPYTSGEPCEVELQTSADNFDLEQAQFYALNLDVLQKCSEMANANKADDISVSNGWVHISVKKEAEWLFLAVPSDDGWIITVNGKPAETELIGDCLYSIKLLEEENEIEMRYHVPNLKMGLAISLLSILGYGIYCGLQKAKVDKSRNAC